MSETPSTNYSMIQPHTSESEQSLSVRPFNVTEPVVAKRICFYKSGDPQFNGVKMVVNSRSFKSFDALLDNLSKKVPLPFGVRNITTPRGIHSITNLDDLEDGKSYICSQQRKIKPINLEMASKKPLPWQISRPISGRRRAVQLAREGEDGIFQRGGAVRISTPKKLLVFKNGDVRIRRTIVLGKKNTQNFEAFLDHISELMQYPVVKLYTTDGRKVPNLQALILCSGAVVAAGREPFKAGNYDPHRYSLPGKLPGISNRVYPRTNAKSESRKTSVPIDSSSRSQIFSASSYKGYSNDNNSDFSYVPDNDMSIAENHSHVGEDLFVVPPEDDIEKSVHLNPDGSMTVEMRVRFKIKEEETIKWTTTVSRAGLSNDRNATIGTSAVVAEDLSSELNILTRTSNTDNFNSAEDNVALQQICTEMTNRDFPSGMEMTNYDIWQNPSMITDVNQEDNDNVKPRFYRPPTPGPKRVRQKKTLVESVTLVSDRAVQKKLIGQFSYSEELDSGENKSEYCVVTHASSKTSNVTSPKHNEICNSYILKQSLEDQIEEEMTNSVGCKATMERSLELPCGSGLLQNVFEQSIVKEGLYNSLTSGSHASHVQSSPRKYHPLGQVFTNQSDATGRKPSSFNNLSEQPHSKSEEVICNQCKIFNCSQAFIHSSSAESNKTIFLGGQMTPTASDSSFITAKNNSTECVTATHLSDESQAASSNSKKKMKKKRKKRKSSLDTRDQGAGSQQNLHDISPEGTFENGVEACEMHITRDNTQNSSTQITIHKKVLAFPIGSSDGSKKNTGTKNDLYHQVSVSPLQNELGSNLKQNLNRQLPQIKSRSDKKYNFSPFTKPEEGLLLVEDNPKHDFEPIKEGVCDITNLLEQASTHLASLKSLTKTGSRHKTEKETVTSDKSHKSSTKQKKMKKNKKIKDVVGTKVNMSDKDSTQDDCRHADFADEITEHALENYVQSWLQNIFPNAVMPAKHLAPMNDRKMHKKVSVKTFSDKGSQLEGENMYLTGKNNISDSELSNSTLNHLSEIGIVGESVKELYERHFSCLTDADASLIEEAQYLLQSDIQNNTKLSMSNIVHEHDRNKIQSEIDFQSLSDHQQHNSEIATQIDTKAITNILGTDAQKDCVSGLLMHQLKTAMLGVENSHIGCIETSCCLRDISSPSLGSSCCLRDISSPSLGSSSSVLLAWLLLLNLKETLSNVCKDDMVQTTCNCSEILMQSQYLKQVVAKEAEDLNAAVSNLQECSGSGLVSSGMQGEKEEPPYCQENAHAVEIKNTSDFEEQGKLNKALIPYDWLNSEEAVDANELIEKLQGSSEGQKDCNMTVDSPNLIDTNVSNTLQNPNSNNDVSNDCSFNDSNEAPPKENGNSSLLESQERNIDTSFNNEDSGLSEEPNSTIHSTSSNDKDHIFDLETSELDDNELKSTEEQKSTESLLEKEKAHAHLAFISENVTNCGREDHSVQEDLEEDGTCEEEQLSPLSPLSFCYESKQIPGDACEEEPMTRVKMIVKELECGSYSNACEFKKCLKSPVTSDLSDYRPDTDDSDYNFRPSSDLTNESAEEGRCEREYSTGYVKRTIERLYGKAEVSFWPSPKPVAPYMAQMLPKDADESFLTVMEEASSLCQACNTWSDEKRVFIESSLTSHDVPDNMSSNLWGKENAALPAPQFSLNGEEAHCIDKYSQTNQHSQSRTNTTEEEGVLIDKGKWLLKENHLIRRSPPENLGMYGNTDTTSADTAFDNHSDDIPYSHFGNLDLCPPLKEISSSELEDMVKPFDNRCNYFNMPHNSDSEPFPDELSSKSRNSQYGSSLHFETTPKICPSSTSHCREVNSNSPALASVEFRLPDNKVHPLEQPPFDEPIQTQPTSNTNSNRNSHEDRDSLDKLHAICGQHCPILTAIIKPTNEEIRGCAYRKASDIENQVGLHLLMNTSHLIWQSKAVMRLDKDAGLKNCCINNIANNIFNRLYADNTLDFMCGNNVRLLESATLKENKGLKKLYATENMDINAQEINRHENNATKRMKSEVPAGQNHNSSVFQSSRSNVNQIVGDKPSASFADVTKGCRSETSHYHGTSLNNIDWKVTVNLGDENALDIKEETVSYIIEEETGNDHSET